MEAEADTGVAALELDAADAAKFEAEASVEEEASEPGAEAANLARSTSTATVGLSRETTVGNLPNFANIAAFCCNCSTALGPLLFFFSSCSPS